MELEHWQRLAAYLTEALVIGLALIFFTHSFIHYAGSPGQVGYITLLIYGFIYLNLGYGINRRYSLKSARTQAVNYLIAFLMTLPTLLWIYTKDEGLGASLNLFAATILFAVFLGSFFGVRKGRSKRKEYLRRIHEEQEEELPDELKRPHDDLSQN